MKGFLTGNFLYSVTNLEGFGPSANLFSFLSGNSVEYATISAFTTTSTLVPVINTMIGGENSQWIS